MFLLMLVQPGTCIIVGSLLNVFVLYVRCESNSANVFLEFSLWKLFIAACIFLHMYIFLKELRSFLAFYSSIAVFVKKTT